MADKQEITEALVKLTEKADNAWVRGLVQMIPGVGSTIDTWVFQYSDKAMQDRIKEQLEALKQQIEGLEVDVKYVEANIEEIAFLFQNTMTLVAQEYRKEKRDAYRTMLGKFMSREFSELDNKDLYLQYLQAMSPMHLVALTVFKDAMNDNGMLTIQPGESKSFVTGLMTEHGVEEPLAEALVNDLVTRSMVVHTQDTAVGGDVHKYGITPVGTTMLALVSD